MLMASTRRPPMGSTPSPGSPDTNPCPNGPRAPAQDVDGQHAQAADGLHAHDGLHGLVQDGVAGVARGLGGAGHLRERVAHRVARVRVARAQDAQQAQDLRARARAAQLLMAK